MAEVVASIVAEYHQGLRWVLVGTLVALGCASFVAHGIVVLGLYSPLYGSRTHARAVYATKGSENLFGGIRQTSSRIWWTTRLCFAAALAQVVLGGMDNPYVIGLLLVVAISALVAFGRQATAVKQLADGYINFREKQMVEELQHEPHSRGHWERIWQ